MCCFTDYAVVGGGSFLGESTHAATQIYVGETVTGQHVLAYSNTVASASQREGGIAMIVHVRTRKLSPQNLVMVKDGDNFFEQMHMAVFPPRYLNFFLEDDFMRSPIGSSEPLAVVVKHGDYHVVVAQDVRAIEGVIDQVPPEKRPATQSKVYEWYAEVFKPEKGWKSLLFCFNNKNAKKMRPVMLWYDPWDQDVIDAPGVDSHTGEPPNLRSEVDVDHEIYFGSHLIPGGVEMRYSGISHAVSSLLASRIIGQRFLGKMPNGDFLLDKHKLLYRSSAYDQLPGVSRGVRSDY